MKSYPSQEQLISSSRRLFHRSTQADHEKLHLQMQTENPALNEMELRKKMMDFYMGQIESLLDPAYRSKATETGVL